MAERRSRAADPARAARTTRKRFARRQWARRWLTWRYVVALTLVLALVGGGVYAVYFSSSLAVDSVEVAGNRMLTDDDVQVAAEVPTGDALATVDLERIAARVRSLAMVKSVDVSRQWPRGVLIEVEERVAVAVVKVGGQTRSLDADGVLFGSHRRPPANLPRVEPGAAAGADALEESALVVAALPAELASVVDHLEVETVDQISLVLRDDRQVRWGSAEESEQKAQVLAALLQRRAQVYDVSVPGQPTTSDAGLPAGG